MRPILARSIFATTLGLLLLASTRDAFAQKEVRLPSGVQRVTSVEGITEYTLPNGFRVLLFPDGSKPTITVNITYRVGSRHEGYGEKGMAHLLEHLVFKGTPRHPNIPGELTKHGARANGTTWFDRTNYYETMDATEENLRWALDLESDRMVNSFISRKDLESEFSVVRNEFESGENNPGAVLNKRMMAAVFQWHNYGKSTIGEKSDIEGAPIERLQAFYRTYYQPDNAVLVVAGKIDEQRTLELVNEYFGKIPRPARKLVPTYTDEPVQDGEREITLRRAGDVQMFAAIYRTAPGSHEDDAALSVLGNLLTHEPSGRLYQALVESKKAVSVSGRSSGFAEGGWLTFMAELRQEQSLPAARAAMLGVLDDLKRHPPTATEVEKARTRLLKNFELSMKQSDRVGLRLSESIGLGDWRLAFLERDRLEKVSPADVGRVVTTYFKTSNRTVGSFIPEKDSDRAPVLEAPDLTSLLKDYKGKPALAQGEDFDTSPENIEKRTRRGQFTNGMRYALLPKETRGDSVNATITLRFGTLENLQGKSTVASFTGAMLDRGTQYKTHEQIRDELDRLKARLSVSGGEASATATIQTDRKHLADVLRLAGEILRQPSFPKEEFDKVKLERLARIEESSSEPGALANNLFARVSRPSFTPGDPRYTMTFTEQAAAAGAVTVEQAKEFHRSFYGASHATAAVVGDFDAVEIEKVLRETFGDWASPTKYERIAENYEPVAGRIETIATPDKANAIYVAGYGFPMRDDDPEYPAITIGGYIMGGGFLNSRLATRIRQKEGLSYGVSGSFFADALDRNGGFSARMIYNPGNLPRIEAAFREEIERAARDGFTAQELEAARTGWLQSRRVGRSSDSALAGSLSRYLHYGRDFTWDAEREKRVQQLTLDQLNTAMKKHLDYSKMISVRAGDFAKKQVASGE
jgi:zinc protease